MTQVRKDTPRSKTGHYSIKHELFWSVLLGISLPLLSFTFYIGHFIGNTKYDMSVYEIRETDKLLRDSLKLQRRTIERMRFVSDSALNIIAHMPYDQMKLDTSEFHKVQSTIEAAGAALYININYKH